MKYFARKLSAGDFPFLILESESPQLELLILFEGF